MNDRQKEILTFLINEYIRSAQPVGSGLLSEKSEMDLSPATYRNELVVLEEEGFLVQPHTSAGRVPTERAYKYFVDECLDNKKILKGTSAPEFKLAMKEKDTELLLKLVAKQIVERSDEAVIVAFDKNNVYYTGLSKLFAQPEFKDQASVVSLSSLVEGMDGVIDKVFDRVSDLEVLIGSNNPFGNSCSTIVGKYKLKNNTTGMFAILGPMRMDYEKNIGLVNSVKALLEGLES